jgi:hypothetical protein
LVEWALLRRSVEWVLVRQSVERVLVRQSVERVVHQLPERESVPLLC